jgi:hypothetical protein
MALPTQTNLPVLKATIEAPRVGEAGRLSAQVDRFAIWPSAERPVPPPGCAAGVPAGTEMSKKKY